MDGRLTAAEVFQSPSLLAAARPGIVEAVALDAVGHTGAAPPPDQAAAQRFLDGLLQAEDTTTEAAGAGLVRAEATSPAGKSYKLKTADGEVVHLNAYAH
jgi:hypothetical protein